MTDDVVDGVRVPDWVLRAIIVAVVLALFVYVVAQLAYRYGVVDEMKAVCYNIDNLVLGDYNLTSGTFTCHNQQGQSYTLTTTLV